MTVIDQPVHADNYFLLRSALALFKKTPLELSAEELQAARNQARAEHDIETKVLQSAEAAGVIITAEAVDKAVQEIRGRFDNDNDFDAELERNGLDRETLEQALQRQCKVENVLERVASRSSTVSDVEIGIYYHTHPEKFKKPEQRAASHILITVNEQFAENQRDNALQQMKEIAAKLQRKSHKFADLALRHSECPTSLQGGSLGVVSKGQLYPEIEAALFALKAGEISAIIESEIGFHLVRCEKIHRAETISFKKAQGKIRKVMQERARRNCQRAWLASLPALPAERVHSNN